MGSLKEDFYQRSKFNKKPRKERIIWVCLETSGKDIFL